MEGTMSEIRMFAGDFAPKSWALCQGQILAINTNQALFALLGTTYGGNGVQTFALPDMRGRIALGTGQGPGLANIGLGEVAGSPTVTATLNNLPLHNHNVVAPTTVTLSTFSDLGELNSSDSSTLAAVPNLFASTADTSTYGSVTSTFVVGATGGNQPMPIEQPYLGMNYVICLYGIFPSRN